MNIIRTIDYPVYKIINTDGQGYSRMIYSNTTNNIIDISFVPLSDITMINGFIDYHKAMETLKNIEDFYKDSKETFTIIQTKQIEYLFDNATIDISTEDYNNLYYAIGAIKDATLETRAYDIPNEENVSDNTQTDNENIEPTPNDGEEPTVPNNEDPTPTTPSEQGTIFIFTNEDMTLEVKTKIIYTPEAFKTIDELKTFLKM